MPTRTQMIRGNDIRALGWLMVFLIATAGLGWAHDPGLSTATAKIFPDRIEAEAIFARGDIEALVRRDADRDGMISSEEADSARDQLEALARNAFTVLSSEVIIQSLPRFHVEEDNFHVAGTFGGQGPRVTIASPLLKQLPRGHRQFVRVLDDQGAILAEALLTAEHDSIDLGRRAAEKVEAARMSTFAEFFFMGVEHILTGYDHLIFLLGLLITVSQFRTTFLIITCFTLAHSATLALAAFDLVRVPGNIVEPLIAATIIYVGAENLLSSNPTGRWRLALIFGLVHGLGFATDLKESVASMVGAQIVVPVVSFNLGVELGQMAVAALALPLIWWLRSRPVFVRGVVPACSVLIVAAGAWWLVERTLG